MYGGKRLIGTPLDAKRHSDLDFTPVGEEEAYERSIRQENNFSPLANKKASFKPSLGNHTIDDSSFDITSHSFDTIASRSHTIKPNMNFLDDINNGKNTDYLRMGNDNMFLSNGTNALRQQHDNLSKLQEENINLKVRLATLTRHLGGEPQDKQDLINHNIELKQSMLYMNSKIERLNLYIKELEASSHQDAVQVADHKELNQARQENEQLQRELASFQHEAAELRREASSNQHEVVEYKALLDNLQEENRLLLRQKEDLRKEMNELQHEGASNNHALELDYKEEIQELNGELSDLQMRLRAKDETIDDLEHEVNQLKLDKQDLEDSVHELKSSLRAKDHEVRQADAGIQDKLEESEEEIARLTSKLKESKHRESALADEIGELRNEASRLADQVDRDEAKIQSLKAKLKELQHTQSRSASNDEYIRSIEKEREALYDQMASTEDKLVELDRALNSANLELNSMKKNRHSNDNDLNKLHNLNDSLLREIDQLKFEIRDQNELMKQIEDLKLKLATRDVGDRREKAATNPYLDQEIKRLNEKNNELQHIVDSMSFNNDSKLQDALRKNNELQKEIDAKDAEIDGLAMRIKELTRQNKLGAINDDDAKLDLMREVSQLKSKLNLATIEKDNLKEEYSMKLSIIKRQLQNEDGSSINASLESKLQQSIRSKEDLLIKLSNKQQELDELLSKNGKLNRDNKELEKIMFALEDNELKLTKENKAYQKEVTKLKAVCTKLVNRLKTQDSTSPGAALDLQQKLDNANEEIDILTNKYLQLRKDLNSKINSLEQSKQLLKQKLIKVSESKAQRQYPTPRSSPVASPSPVSSLQATELKLAKARNHEQQQTIKDLQVYNTILNKSLQRSNMIVKQNIITIDKHIDSETNLHRESRPLSFKALAKFVLASVRMRRRVEEASLNKTYISWLNKEIKREKLDLL